MGKTFDEFQQEVKTGTPGDQTQWGLYRLSKRGVWERIRHAEGNQITLEPETVERNYIDMKQSATEVMDYKESFDKNIVVEKGDADYEFFHEFFINRYVGKDALLDLLEVDFNHSERDMQSHLWYIAVKTKMTVTVTSLDATAATLAVSFSQYGSVEYGIAACLTENPDEPTFKNEKSITPIMATPDPASITLAVGETKLIPIVFTSFGVKKNAFSVSVPSAQESKVKVERVRDSVAVTGLASTATPVTVTVASVQSQSVSQTIEVTVS
jgi:hypothetical protein